MKLQHKHACWIKEIMKHPFHNFQEILKKCFLGPEINTDFIKTWVNQDTISKWLIKIKFHGTPHKWILCELFPFLCELFPILCELFPFLCELFPFSVNSFHLNLHLSYLFSLSHFRSSVILALCRYTSVDRSQRFCLPATGWNTPKNKFRACCLSISGAINKKSIILMFGTDRNPTKRR